MTLPQNLEEIYVNAFTHCEKLTSLTIPDSVTTIGADAFYQCLSLASITIPENVTAIGTGAFESCDQLKSVTFADADSEWTISDNEIFIPDNDDPAANAAALTTTYVASYWSKGGTHVHTASDWVTDGDNHWKECIVCGAEMDKVAHKFSSAEYVMGNEHHWKVCSVCGPVKEDHVFEDGAQNCSVCGVTNGSNFVFSAVSGGYSVKQNGTPYFSAAIVLPEYYEAESGDKPITTIGNSAFAGNTTFTTITLPDSVTSIGSEAFSGCHLDTIFFPESSLVSIGDYAFSGCIFMSITIPDSVTTIGSDAFANCWTLKSVTLPTNSQFTTISDNLFEECYMLTSITIPASVTAIGQWAFYACGDLATVTIPEDSSLTSIGDHAFNECTDLSVIHLPDSLKTIGDSAFESCETLTEITIPANCTTIGESAFSYNSQLKTVVISDSVTSIGEYAFSDCEALTSVTFPENSNFTTISDCLFNSCIALEQIDIPNNVKYIGMQAFVSCENLGQVKAGRLETIGTEAFRGCVNLISWTRLNAIEIGEGAFSESGLRVLTLDEVQTIGTEAFAYNEHLNTLTISGKVETIGIHAFFGCSLTSVTFTDESSEWNISDGSVFVPDNDDPANKNGEALKTTYVAYTWTKGEQHVHTAGEEWVSDSTKHWQICTGCGARMNEEKHAPTADGYSLGTEGHWFDCKCGERVTEEHDFHDGISQNCTRCGMTDPKYFDVMPADSGDGYALHLKRQYAESITGTLVFPEYDGNGRGEDDPITEIGPNFFQMENVTSIVLPETLKVIDEYAFMRNPITSITIPAGVTSIGNEAFTHCKGIDERHL